MHYAIEWGSKLCVALIKIISHFFFFLSFFFFFLIPILLWPDDIIFSFTILFLLTLFFCCCSSPGQTLFCYSFFFHVFFKCNKITPRRTKEHKKKHSVKGLDMMTTVTQLMSEKYFNMKMKVLSCMQFMQNSGRIKLSMKQKKK